MFLYAVFGTNWFDFVKVDDLRRNLNTINDATREVTIKLVSLLFILTYKISAS